MLVRWLAALVFVGAVGAALGTKATARQSAADPLQQEMCKALGTSVSRVERSARLRGPTTTVDGQYVLHLNTKPPREVGLVAYKQQFSLNSAPFFWINLKGDIDKGEPTQVVLLPTDTGLRRDEIPSDWIMSDYLHDRKPTRSPSFIAINPPRTVTKMDDGGKRWSADSGWVASHPVAPNQLARTIFVADPQSQKLTVYAFMLHRLSNEAEGQRLMKQLETLAQ